MDSLTVEKLRRLYFDYIEYRDSLSFYDHPVSVKEFFEAERHRYVDT